MTNEAPEPAALPRVALVAMAEGLIEALGPRHGVLTQSIEDAEGVIVDMRAHEQAFMRRVETTVRRLGYEYGESVDEAVVRSRGLTPDLLLGPQLFWKVGPRIALFSV